ncbi:MAG: peptide ABC transporter substrate-binding protein [Chloroflexi bacterium]|nr:peptide ABC transporter substrate-binding protein [Chloroflexota bacterium]MDA1218141.1 peptide ABC transporter substrate-binding protein [Chloroflexota bacterium]
MAWKSLIAMVIGSLFLTACSTVSTPATPEPTTPQTSPSTASSTATTPSNTSTTPNETFSLQAQVDAVDAAQGGKLVRLFRDPPTLDPHLTTDNISGALVNEVYSGLVNVDLDLNVVPDLAETIDVSDDGRTYTFHLRSNAKFHDGKTVTAPDVKWSLERVTNPETQAPVAAQYLSDIVGVTEKLNGSASSIEGVRVVDDRTIEITIDAPKSYFLAKLTYPTAFVLDRDNIEGKGNDWLRQPNGTGPFKLAQYDIGEILRLERNDNYYRKLAYLDEIDFILSGGTAMLMYENNEIHLTGVGIGDLDRVLDPSEPLNAQLQTAPSNFSVDYIGLNVEQPPLDDPKLRLALNLAFDREAIATQVLSNLRTPANGIIPMGFPSYNTNLSGYQYDPEMARQLLKESKYGNDLDNLPRITLNISGSFGANVPLDLEVILQAWEQELGIQVDIQQTEWATFLQDLHARRYQMFTIAWGADYPDPENFLDVLFYTGSDNNQTNYSNPEVDALLEQARVEGDQAKRFELYNRIEQMILDEAPWVPLWNSGESYLLLKPEVKGYYLTPMTIPKYRHVYIIN